MAMDFPNSPTNGQRYTATNGLTYRYDSTSGSWTLNQYRYQQIQANFTAVASQQTFPVPGGYAPGLVQVFKNGIKLINGVTVTVTSGTNVVTASPCAALDTVEVVGLQAFSISAGYLIGAMTYLTASSGTYTVPTGCRALIVEAQGAGASGGGSASTSAGETAVSSGGGAGGYAEKLVTSLSASYAYTVGAGGAAPSAGNNNGNDGAATTFNVTTCVGNGGIKGIGAAATSSFQAVLGGLGGTATGGDDNVKGGSGERGVSSGANIYVLPNGGVNTMWGVGRNSAGQDVAATAGANYGNGGSGVANGPSQAARAGAVGANGVIRITELY